MNGWMILVAYLMVATTHLVVHIYAYRRWCERSKGRQYWSLSEQKWRGYWPPDSVSIFIMIMWSFLFLFWWIAWLAKNERVGYVIASLATILFYPIWVVYVIFFGVRFVASQKKG